MEAKGIGATSTVAEQVIGGIPGFCIATITVHTPLEVKQAESGNAEVGFKMIPQLFVHKYVVPGGSLKAFG